MKLLHISALGLTAMTLAAAYGCSSAETERLPVYVDAAGGSKASGGGASLGMGGSKASGAGGASVGSGGKSGMGGASVGSGGANSGSGGKGSGGASSGSGGANSASGGANNGTGGANNAPCTPTAAGVAAMLKTHKCSECHTDFTTEAGLTMQIDLADEDGKRDMCGSHTIVAAGDPSMSTLYLKLAGMDVPNCGAQMPKGMTALSTSELQCVSDWITSAMAP